MLSPHSRLLRTAAAAAELLLQLVLASMILHLVSMLAAAALPVIDAAMKNSADALATGSVNDSPC
jgi:hypothetical protein